MRWSSHSYGEMRDACEGFEKQLVRLHDCYIPVMIARGAIDQAGARRAIA